MNRQGAKDAKKIKILAFLASWRFKTRSNGLTPGGSMRSRSLGLLALLALGCGEEADSPVLVGPVPRYADPGSLGRGGCVAGSLAGLDPSGIWHLDNQSIANPPFGSAIRYGGPGDAGVRIDGHGASTVRRSADDLFARAEYRTVTGELRIRAYNVCARGSDGSLLGRFGRCNGKECFTGTFRAVRVERIPGEVERSGIEKISEWAGDPASPWGDAITVNVRVKDGLAYLARYGDGLRIVDVSDPASPRDVGASPVALPGEGELYNDVKLVDGPGGKRYALMASNRRGVVSVNVTNPASPVEAVTFPHAPDGADAINVHTLFTEVQDGVTRAYLADLTTGGLDVYDVSDPAAPVPLGAFVHPALIEQQQGSTQPMHLAAQRAFVHDLYVEGGRATLNYWGLGLVVVDASDPANIAIVGAFDDYERRSSHSNWVTTAGGRRISVQGDEDFGAHVRIVDVDEQSGSFMSVIGELALRPEVSVHNIMALGDRAYVAYYQDGLRILDLSDPAAPRVEAYFNTWDGRNGGSFYEGAIGVDVDLTAGLIYVADTERGLLIFRQEPPAAP
jgi:hypothetical protein